MIGKNRYFPKTIENEWNYTSFESSRQAYFENWRIIDLARSIPEISMKKAISSIRLLRDFVSHIFHKDASNEIFDNFIDILISIVIFIFQIFCFLCILKNFIDFTNVSNEKLINNWFWERKECISDIDKII